MSTLTTKQVVDLMDLITLMNAAKITTGTIRGTSVSAMNDGDVFALMGEIDAFPLPMALTRIQQLKARIDLVKGHDGFAINYSEKNNEIRDLKIVSNSNTADFRCFDVESVNVPKKVMGVEPVASFVVKSSIVNDVQNAVSAYATGKDSLIKFTTVDNTVLAFVSDDNGDQFTTVVADTDTSEEISFSYNADVITRLLKLAMTDEGVKVGIGKKGILSINHKNYNFYVQPGKER